MYSPLKPYAQTERDTRLVSDILKAIKGEYSAISCYTQLAEKAPTEEEKKRILEIREDEISHFRVFSNIYTRLTGKHPTPTITEPCPEKYLDGLEFAVKDEQETVDFYLEIADKASNHYIKQQFYRAAADEQNHAVWFLYFYTKHYSHH